MDGFKTWCISKLVQYDLYLASLGSGDTSSHYNGMVGSLMIIDPGNIYLLFHFSDEIH